MTLSKRVLLARRHAGLTQAGLAEAVGVQRSAVSHWESGRSAWPSAEHLGQIAIATGVNFEWLATNRGKMRLHEDARLDSIACADALLIDDHLEQRLIRAIRSASVSARIALVELAEHLSLNKGARRKGRAPE